MQLRRYHCKVKGKGNLFSGSGEYERSTTFDYDWLLQDGTIGILPQATSEAECFYGGFLGRSNNGLIVVRQPRLGMYRKDIPTGCIARAHGRAGEGGEIEKLLDILTAVEGAHAFLTQESPQARARVLTFSRQAPSADTYNEVTPISIEFK